MIADSENMLYNNPVNMKYKWRKEIQEVCERISHISKVS